MKQTSEYLNQIIHLNSHSQPTKYERSFLSAETPVVDTHSLIIKEHFLSYSPAAWELCRGRISAHVWIDSQATQIFLLTIQKESLLSKPDILPFPSVSAACFSPSKTETRRGSWASGEALGSRSESATVRGFFALLSGPRGEGWASQEFSELQTQWWTTAAWNSRLQTDCYTAGVNGCVPTAAQLQEHRAQQNFTCLLWRQVTHVFLTLYLLLWYPMWTLGARELCETCNVLLLKLCFSYHRNTVTTGTEYAAI